MSKKFPTLVTLMRLFSSVDSLVLKKSSFVDEGLPTVTALEWFCFIVKFPVFREGGPLSKKLPTLVTLMRFFSRVNSLVLKKSFLLDKGVPTVIAFEQFWQCERGLTIFFVSLWMLSTVSGLMLNRVLDSQAILLIFFTWKVIIG